ncbi:hypothetical protein Airi02_045170 [Actinoallomurus iriomotensis]|uniref:Uncharacterized protein n=1 Tax=Actinoallomurus iriomotensis TaxID=478107 RepID=A0A9W6VVD6_9ACTN|nr:hypothetical protein Airi02_045170 [Actinoallomurus iriomotensis]
MATGHTAGAGPYPDGDPEAIRALAAEARLTVAPVNTDDTAEPRPTVATAQTWILTQRGPIGRIRPDDTRRGPARLTPAALDRRDHAARPASGAGRPADADHHAPRARASPRAGRSGRGRGPYGTGRPGAAR